jgi:hypothetical protein
LEAGVAPCATPAEHHNGVGRARGSEFVIGASRIARTTLERLEAGHLATAGLDPSEPSSGSSAALDPCVRIEAASFRAKP